MCSKYLISTPYDSVALYRTISKRLFHFLRILFEILYRILYIVTKLCIALLTAYNHGHHLIYYLTRNRIWLYTSLLRTITSTYIHCVVIDYSWQCSCAMPASASTTRKAPPPPVPLCYRSSHRAVRRCALVRRAGGSRLLLHRGCSSAGQGSLRCALASGNY